MRPMEALILLAILSSLLAYLVPKADGRDGCLSCLFWLPCWS